MEFDKAIDPRINVKSQYVSWDVFRRKQLENICKLEHIPVREGATHDEMKIMLKSNDVDPKKYADVIFLGALHGDSRDPRIETLESVVRAEKPLKYVVKDVNFQKMQMYELRQECKLQGISFTKNDKKVDLLKKIQDKMNGNAASGS